jgi:hypothetical protein
MLLRFQPSLGGPSPRQCLQQMSYRVGRARRLPLRCSFWGHFRQSRRRVRGGPKTAPSLPRPAWRIPGARGRNEAQAAKRTIEERGRGSVRPSRLVTLVEQEIGVVGPVGKVVDRHDPPHGTAQLGMPAAVDCIVVGDEPVGFDASDNASGPFCIVGPMRPEPASIRKRIGLGDLVGSAFRQKPKPVAAP